MAKNNKAFNVKIILAGEFERYKVYDQPFNVPDNKGYTGKRGQAKDQDKSIKQAMIRAKDKIYGYIMANNWDYWATQTFNSDVIDRFNLDEIIKKYNRRLKYLKTKYDKLKWLIVPEMHRNGAWHLHMFMAGIPKDKIVYSGYDYYNKNKHFSRRVYNWVDTIDYGFNDYLYIGDVEPLERYKMANYVTKYITKDLVTKRFNKKMYWSSKGLAEPKKINTLTNNIDEILSTGIIITQNSYYIKNKDTGEIFNKVNDLTLYNPLPF